MNEIDLRHLNSFSLFGIEACGFWTAKEGATTTSSQRTPTEWLCAAGARCRNPDIAQRLDNMYPVIEKVRFIVDAVKQFGRI